MTNKNAKPENNSKETLQRPNVETQKDRTPITVAWIGVVGIAVGAIIAAFPQVYPIFIDKTPTFQPTAISSETYTVTPNLVEAEPTFTPVPATETVTALPTFSQAIPIPIGEDWLQGCVSTLWKVYPASVQLEENGYGCWKEPVSAFSAEYGDLDFLKERGKGFEEVYGLYTLLPQSGTITFTLRLEDLTNADLLIGILTEPDVTSEGLLLAVLHGDVKNTVILQKDGTYQTIQGTVPLDIKNGQTISLEFDPLSAKGRVLPSFFSTNPFPLHDSTKWLFLGFKGLYGSYRIEGRFLNFQLIE